MANTILTPTMITREALRILHNKLTFVGSINRQYDDRFAREGAKIGTTLQIRLPNQYVIRTGAVMQTQDTTENKVDLTVATQQGVDVNFSSVELTLSLDDFSKRILEPAMATLSSNVEEAALNMVLDVYNCTGASGTVPSTLAPFTLARAKMNQFLTPKDTNRHAMVDSTTMATMVEGLKSLFNKGADISFQYKEGLISGMAAGFNWWENDLAPRLTAGTLINTDTPLVNGANQVGATLSINWTSNASATLKKGQIFTLAGVYTVHPETKAAYAALQQFVVTANTTGSGSAMLTLPISPSIVTSGALQNVSNSPIDDAVITLFDAAASVVRTQDICYHQDAFTFVTADLEMPKGVDFAAREVYDGISMRIVRNYDIINDKFPCRIDVLYGYKTLRAQLACRVSC